MKKLIPLFILLSAGVANAEWRLNPYTQRQDYYETGVKLASSTIVGPWESTQSSFSTCVTGSTVTITVSAGSRVEVFFSGGVGADTQDTRVFSYMKDGVLADNGLPLTRVYGPITFHPVAFYGLTDALTAGTYSFCLTAATAGGSIFIYKNEVSVARFWVREVR